ncbi:hypothetical protein EPUS_03599 [Endocarpon pusillum Z07020]|uniref:Uncharacterized protein n=1 Tax=Endocarpon pusillum (strain Z07020 / HMAS-L-300199) TaxID=1263415 RepID=U1FYQ0_ENDPU|nr:uncharacterized protein EPUS_03599 [Endocarpon pusillum Z07020]ERF70047.1 hypothetical protein EPUS_03599 [Endocarpon pusillum Z07020]
MAPSDEQKKRPSTNGAPEGYPVEPSYTGSVPESALIPDNLRTSSKPEERGRPTHRNSDRNRSTSGLSAPLRESQGAGQVRGFSNSHTCTGCPQPRNSDEVGGAQTTVSDPERQSPSSTSANRSSTDDNNDKRDQGFMLEDFMIDMFLTQQRARLENTPVYRVVSWLPEYSAYGLQLYHDPAGRAPLWIMRNWAEIRLYSDAVADERSEESD